MTLSPTQLASDFEAVFASFPDTPADAADALAQAYGDYAAAGVFGSSTPAIPPASVTALASTHFSAMIFCRMAWRSSM